MFIVHHSNSLDLLKSLLINVIKTLPLDNPFDKEIVLVQSPGMSQWLQMEVARAMGVVANMDFPLPATFIWDMFVELLSEVPKRSLFNKEAMTWKLMHILPFQLDDSDFSELKQYLQDDRQQLKLFQLAGKIADVFDQYLVYRPDWIEAWETEKTVPELLNEPRWQMKLWRALHDHTGKLGQPLHHRANMYDGFIDVLLNHTH